MFNKDKKKDKKKEERFEIVYQQGTLGNYQIFVDRETGVNYIFYGQGYAGGLSPLLDKDGKPIITGIDE